MGGTASEKMLASVEFAKTTAKGFEDEFDRKSSLIQSKAKRAIDLFGNDRLSRVKELAADSKDACDTLYAGYQILLLELDDQCRPLLNDRPNVQAVKAVCDMVIWLNEESKIENNFTASFNGIDLGDIVQVQYFPSLESKQIQTFWEMKYQAWPGRKELEEEQRHERKLQKEKERKKREQKEHKRIVAANKKLEAWKNDYIAWEKKCIEWEDAQEREEDRVEKLYLEKTNSLSSTFEKNKEEKNKVLKLAEETLSENQKELQVLGFFKFSERKQKKTKSNPLRRIFVI